MTLFSFLQFAFIQKALIAGIFIGLLCSVLGLFLVLRRLSLIGDGLSHISFGAVALGLFFGFYPIYVAIPVVILGSLVILKISEKAKVYGDTAIGIVSAFGISGGIILASLSHGFNVDLFSYLFGNILSISTSEMILSIILSAMVILVILFFFYDLFSVSFEEEYAKTTGIKTNAINTLLVILAAVTVVLAIRIVGIMLISSMLILPAATALQIAKSFKGALLVSALIACFSVIFGIIISFLLDLPAGATIVLLGGLIFIAAFAYRKIFS
jgi:zinc transport system permease protein